MKNDLVKEVIKDGYCLRIFQDENPLNPRTEWNNFGIMACWHNRYDLGDVKVTNGMSMQEFHKHLEAEEKCIYKNLYLYDHSGITMSIKPFSCKWDSGQVGFIYVTPEMIKKEFNITEITEEIIEKVYNILDSEVKIYDQYLTGEVYGFSLDCINYGKLNLMNLKFENLTNSQQHLFLDDVDSCFGFFGDDFEKNGIKDNLGNFAYLLNEDK